MREVLVLAGFNQGDVDRKPIGLGRHGQVSSLQRLKVGYFEGSNSHLILKVLGFAMGR
jgi:hypothetical protein